MKSRHRVNYVQGLALGVLLGFFASTFVLWIIDETSSTVGFLFKEYITVGATIFAAWIALLGISKQIQSNIEAFEDDRLRRLDAARATLPIVLSTVSDICEDRYRAIIHGKTNSGGFSQWEISNLEVETLKECIQHSEGEAKKFLQEILRIYQVLISRWRASAAIPIAGTPKLEEGDPKMLSYYEACYGVLNWCLLKSICDSLFGFSRGEILTDGQDEIRKRTFHRISLLADGQRDDEGGWLLTNHPNFSEFLANAQKRDKISLLDDDWS